MAFIELSEKGLEKNIRFLNELMKANGKQWSAVSKLLCGQQEYIQLLIKFGAKEICDSRVSNLKVVKELDPSVQTVYIKPPARRSIKDIIKYADVSFNTELPTIKWLSDEAVKQGKEHKVIIMIELGDLREGVMGDELIDFYASVFKLPNITVSGIGANLNCLNGVLPSEDKMVILALYKQLIEAKFGRSIPWVTGGTSAMIPMLMKDQIPSAINHFRIGETLFFGNDILSNDPIEEMDQNVLRLFAEIIEINQKPMVPIGVLDANPSGEVFEVNEEEVGKSSFRAILDVGLLDLSTDFIFPEDPEISIIGASSDMLVMDLGENTKGLKVGDLISFRLKYMGALRLMNSDYIGKKLV